MIFPIGRLDHGWTIAREADGALRVAGVIVTDDRGWIEVRVPSAAAEHDAPLVAMVRLRGGRGTGGRAFVDATEIVADGRSYQSLIEVMATSNRVWLRGVADAVLATIRERVAQPASRADRTGPWRPLRNEP